MITCELCGHENDESAAACLACGNDELPAGRSAAARDRFAGNVVVFRFLVVTSAVSYLIWIGFGFLDSYIYTRDMLDALAWQGYGALMPIPPLVAWAMPVLQLVCAVGLFRFSWPARLIFTLLIIANWLMIPFGGIGVSTPIGSVFGSIIGLADGATLVMAWTAPLNTRFQNL